MADSPADLSFGLVIDPEAGLPDTTRIRPPTQTSADTTRHGQQRGRTTYPPGSAGPSMIVMKHLVNHVCFAKIAQNQTKALSIG